MLVNWLDCRRIAANERPACEEIQPTLEDTSASDAESSDDSESDWCSTAANLERTPKIRTRSSSGFADNTGEQQSCSTSTESLPGAMNESFFRTVSPTGYPAPRSKSQPWKKHWSLSKQSLCTPGTGEMVVKCGKLWDYGEVVRVSSLKSLSNASQDLAGLEATKGCRQ